MTDYGSSCSDCTLTHNTATGNPECGVVLDDSSANGKLFLNVIGSNGLTNAMDNATYNSWDDGVSRGNYWSDYDGTGVYPIPGTGDNVDRFPFGMEMSIDHPADIEYEEGSTDNSVTWTPVGSFPDRYELYRNGLLVGSGDWGGSEIAVSVDDLGVGTYNYTIAVYDDSGNWESDTVPVTVTSPTTTTTTTTTETSTGFPLSGETVMLVAAVGAIIIVVVLVVRLRKRWLQG